LKSLLKILKKGLIVAGINSDFTGIGDGDGGDGGGGGDDGSFNIFLLCGLFTVFFFFFLIEKGRGEINNSWVRWNKR
jgi:hypothetical protein